ncbi:PREDICTED: uncharacterized protein LOC104802359 [Tarenaya hassleriana]|uniref:uncharacterized protein LOC104802359 n=1 Tax=Tarenaya hassleriana TaxID=28532 RepID=UPI00053C60B1|nr:PREDICTED: uncharacterized protein LOC104802359 [Tarenaya hassleriana]
MMMKGGRPSKNVQSKRSAKNGRREQKQQQQVNGAKRSQEQEKPKALDAKEDLNTDPTTQSESCEVYETVDVHYVDDNANASSSDAHQGSDSGIVTEKTAKGEKDEEEEDREDEEEEDYDVKSVSEVVNVNGMAEEPKDAEVWEDASTGALSAGSENELPDGKENGRGGRESEGLKQKIEALETRMEKLEEELREVAALEISLYSVVPDHSSSAHKLHTPARRLSRLYIHSCKHLTQRNRATIARNTVSGLILVAKSCGNDVPRLTFWLSNAIALREIIAQAFGRSLISTKISDSNGKNSNGSGKPTSQKWRKSSGTKLSNGFSQLFEDWQDTETFIAALEKVESWVFSRIVESVWWQVFTPHMQSPETDVSTGKMNGKLMGPSLGDEQQGNFSISLWKNAFQDALRRLCPIRGSGHECGCLPVLARLVMEQCIARFDIAMFNAILRESEHQIPTDPVSDPILDSKVLPIPAGDLSFGSGAQLKNAVGNWSRCLTELFGLNSDDSVEDENRNSEHVKSFLLLNELSDLLMLPKDMLMDRSIREEVCPSIGLPLIKRILCNFTPDEFCPDHVPGAVLEELNAESFPGRKLSGESSRSFPYAASPVFYIPPSSVDVAEKVAEAGDVSKLSRNVSMIQRKGYTSDEELEEMNSPLTSIIDKVSLSPNATPKGNVKKDENVGPVATNARYELLREVWSM